MPFVGTVELVDIIAELPCLKELVAIVKGLDGNDTEDGEAQVCSDVDLHLQGKHMIASDKQMTHRCYVRRAYAGGEEAQGGA